MKYKDVLIEGSDSKLSLVKIVGKKIKDITGYITTELGDTTFELISIKFEDGTDLWLEAEHDTAYVYKWGNKPPKGFDNKIEEIYKSDPNNKEE